MRAYERFLKYIHFDTASNEESPTCPSTNGQLVLAEALKNELLELGLTDARIEEGYVYATIPANTDGQPAIGLIAHMDTVSNVPCMPMNEQIIKNYDGKDITLLSGHVIDLAHYPDLAARKGKDVIVTDGNTILGADDKAGVAEIMTMAETLVNHPEIKHGKVCIGFTPDEEIGRGADKFNVPDFGADFAYTVDGGSVGEMNYETFNAASAKLTFKGVSIHPGSAKDRMVHAALIAMEYNSMLPPFEVPSHTEKYEGFYHMVYMNGTEESATLAYIIRDHSAEKFEERKAFMQTVADFINKKYAPDTCTMEIKDSYRNMREIIEKNMEIVERAKAAFKKVGVEPFCEPVRGGTDGSNLSYMGLPCPNLSTGGMNCHGRLELVAIQDMDKMTDMLIELVKA